MLDARVRVRAVVTCGNCGASQGVGNRFCVECGAQLGLCPSCGELAAPGQRFCGACGHALRVAGPVTPASAPQVSGPVAQRRVCSVLFCDLVGFTPLSEARDPEAVRELLREKPEGEASDSPSPGRSSAMTR